MDATGEWPGQPGEAEPTEWCKVENLHKGKDEPAYAGREATTTGHDVPQHNLPDSDHLPNVGNDPAGRERGGQKYGKHDQELELSWTAVPPAEQPMGVEAESDVPESGTASDPEPPRSRCGQDLPAVRPSEKAPTRMHHAWEPRTIQTGEADALAIQRTACGLDDCDPSHGNHEGEREQSMCDYALAIQRNEAMGDEPVHDSDNVLGERRVHRRQEDMAVPVGEISGPQRVGPNVKAGPDGEGSGSTQPLARRALAIQQTEPPCAERPGYYPGQMGPSGDRTTVQDSGTFVGNVAGESEREHERDRDTSRPPEDGALAIQRSYSDAAGYAVTKTSPPEEQDVHGDQRSSAVSTGKVSGPQGKGSHPGSTSTGRGGDFSPRPQSVAESGYGRRKMERGTSNPPLSPEEQRHLEGRPVGACVECWGCQNEWTIIRDQADQGNHESWLNRCRICGVALCPHLDMQWRPNEFAVGCSLLAARCSLFAARCSSLLLML